LIAAPGSVDPDMCSVPFDDSETQGSEKPEFFEKGQTHWVLGFLALLVLYLNDPLGSLLFAFIQILWCFRLSKFITCWSLEAINIKKSLIVTGMTN